MTSTRSSIYPVSTGHTTIEKKAQLLVVRRLFDGMKLLDFFLYLTNKITFLDSIKKKR